MEKRILDEATRKALQGYLPFSPDCSIEFTPEEFKVKKEVPSIDGSINLTGEKTFSLAVPVEFQPKFSIRSFTRGEKTQYTAIYQNAKKDAEGNTLSSEYKDIGDKTVKIFRACVVSWRDLFDIGNGNEIVYTSKPSEAGCSEESWELLPSWIQLSIANEIRKISNLTPIEQLSLK